ncbi:MAG: CvpA family protein [Alphaproteobacteria bacterium]
MGIGINIVDIIFIVIVLLSAILSYQKGFIQEIMRISSWIGAGGVALYSYNPILPHVKKYVDMEIGASAITGASSFILSLVIFYIISHFISGIVKYSPIGSVNKSLGFIFGIIKGILICSVMYITVNYLFDGKRIDEFQTAKTEPVLTASSKVIISALPENFENMLAKTVGVIEQNADKAKSLSDTYNKLNQPNLDAIGDLIDENIE